MRDKRLDQFSIRLFKAWCAAEVCGVRFDEHGIELVLADQDTQPVSRSLGCPLPEPFALGNFMD